MNVNMHMRWRQLNLWTASLITFFIEPQKGLLLNTKPQQLSQNDDGHDNYDEMMHASKHKQREMS